MTRTAHYLRYSSEEMVRGISLQSQLARLKSESAAAHEEVVATYIDQARSGTKAANRPNYQAMLAAARRHEFDRIRIESVDRGHRNDTERRAFETELATIEVEVIYCGEPLKQAPDQRKFQRGLRGLLAELESDTISQRVYDRQVTRARKGKWRGGSHPYGLLSDGEGWFIPDPDSYPVLVWILERRAEGMGYSRITKLHNQGIAVDGGDVRVPPTPGMLAYHRRPYLERQDLVTGDVIQHPKPEPKGLWLTVTVRRICAQAVDGVYSGVLIWGKTVKRFAQDRYGNPKQPIRTDTGRALVDDVLLLRVQSVELGRTNRQQARVNLKNSFLLKLECGACGNLIHGYTSTTHKKGKAYRYRCYRCDGRSINAGTCSMPMLRAERIEQVVVEALIGFIDAQYHHTLADSINDQIEHYRQELLRAIPVLEQQQREVARRRDEALNMLVRPDLSAAILTAFERRAEGALSELAALETNLKTVRAGLEVLDVRARSLMATVRTLPMAVDGIEESEIRLAWQRAIALLVHTAVLHHNAADNTYRVALSLYDLSDLIRELGSGGNGYYLILTKPIPVGYITDTSPITESVSVRS